MTHSQNGPTITDDTWKAMQWSTADAVAIAEVSRSRAMPDQVGFGTVVCKKASL